jgi:hyperosmotically inducible protein
MKHDELIKERVDEALFKKMDNADVGIKSMVSNGNVILSGIVDTLSEKSYAVEIIKQLPGVKEVEDALTVSMDGKIDDDDITQKIIDRLVLEPKLKDSKIGITTRQGHVFLKGKIATLAEAELAETLASTVMGVNKVINKMNIARSEEDFADDISLCNELVNVISNSEEFFAPDVDATCRDGVIYLSGSVSTTMEKGRIEDLAKTIPGVRRVVNELMLEN